MILTHDNIQFYETAGMGSKKHDTYCGDDTIIFTVKMPDGMTKISPTFVLRMNSEVSILTQVKKILDRDVK